MLFNPGCQPLPLNDPPISSYQSYLCLSWLFFPQSSLKTAMNPSPSSSWFLTCKCNRYILANQAANDEQMYFLSPRMKRGELFDYLTERVTLSEKETRSGPVHFLP